jgi:cysteine-rich repeat protein
VCTVCACGDDGPAADTLAVEAGLRPDAAAAQPVRCGDAGGDACGDGYRCVEGRCQADMCGDGLVSGDEECDDGNEATGDGCDPACRVEESPRCGDGELHTDDGEECDDGNFYDADVCSNACTVNECGNARTDMGEECDDGDLIDDNECSNDCLENRCRNGRLDMGEECDDGNRIHDDGCSNACLIVVCPNGRVEGEEECDDDNDVDDDGCSNACTENVCGNMRIDPGEVCDGDTVEYACADDCKGMAENVCRPCEEMHCTDYQGVDVVASCFDADIPQEILGETQVDAEWAQHCVDAVNCARRSGCGLDPAFPTECYCGAQTVDECNLRGGPTDDAPCAEEWRAATRGTTHNEIMVNWSAIDYPSGWVDLLLQCDRMYCAAECVPQ